VSPFVLEKILADVAFWIGLVSVLLFAYSRFNISLPNTDELSPPLEPRSFTTAFRFQLAAFTYVGLFIFVYFTLLLASSFPWLQEVVTKLFGSLDGADSEPVGTPAWAALVATSVLPSTPGFRAVDEWCRVRLHDFASIPSKARMLGREILKALPYPAPEPVADDAALPTLAAALDRHKERFAKLREVADTLVQTESARAARRYAFFFAENQGILDKLDEEFAVDAEHCNTPETARYVEKRFRAALRKMARLIACAMLNAEPSEFAIRMRLQAIGLSVRIVGFDFRPGHLVLAFTTIAVMTLVGCYAAVFTYAYRYQVDSLPIVAEFSPTFFSWVLVTVVTYSLPIVLAAGVEMYLLDRATAGDPVDGADYAAISILTFLGAAGLSFFALLAWNFIKLKLAGHGPGALVQLWQILPWSLPPATVATVFLIMAGRETGAGRAVDLGLDALVHGSAAAFASLVALLLAMLAGSTFQHLPPGIMPYLAPMTATGIGATIGAVLCATCRRKLGTLVPAPLPSARVAGRALAET
jgi:hypothetical protein